MHVTAVELPTLHLTRHVGKDLARRAPDDGLTRLHRGAYVHVPPDLTGKRKAEFVALARCVAYAEQLRATVVFSHDSAALLHGLPLWTYGRQTHVYQSYSWSGEGDPDLVRRAGHLAPEDCTTVHGIPVTTLERTAVDCARTMHPRDALVVVDAALRRLASVEDRDDRDASLRRVEEARAGLLERVHALGPARGVAQARAVIAAADGLAESPGESVMRWVAVSRGLPAPELQYPVRTRIGTFYLDGAWHGDGWRLGIEHDGSVKYCGEGPDAAAVVEREKRREDAIREDGGYRMLRTVTKDLGRVRETFARMCTALPTELVRGAEPVLGLYVP